MKEKDEKVLWSRSNGSLFEDFAISLEEYTKTGRTPAKEIRISNMDWSFRTNVCKRRGYPYCANSCREDTSPMA